MNVRNTLPPDATARRRVLWRLYKAMARTYTFPASLYYTAALLVLRTITAGWNAQQAIYRQRYGADSPQVARMMAFYRFQLPEACSFEYLLLHRGEDGIAALVTLALRQIDACNPDTLQGILREIDFTDARPGATGAAAETIRLALKYLSPTAFDTDAGDAFQFLLEKLASARENNNKALFVPPTISHLVALLAAPRAGERICDPVCGCGSLLIQTILHTRTHSGSPSRNFSAYGQEHHDVGFRLTRMHTLLHGLAGVRLEPASSITDPRFHEGGTLTEFDVVVANLMLPLEHWGYTEALTDQHQRFRHGLPPKSKGDYAYIQHILATLAPGGRAVVLLAQHTLSRGGVESGIRQSLVKANVIDAVIALPANLFPVTSASTALLVLRPSRIRREILFIDARQHYQSGRKQHVLQPSDITRMTAAYVRYENQQGLAVCISGEEIARNNFSLSVVSYIHRDAPAMHTDIALLQQEIDRLDAKLRQTRNTLDTLLDELQNAHHDATVRATLYTPLPEGDVIEDPDTPYGIRSGDMFTAVIRQASPHIPDTFASIAGEAIQAVYQQRIIRDWTTNTDWQRETDGDIEQLLYTLATERGLSLTETVCAVIRSACRKAAILFIGK